VLLSVSALECVVCMENSLDEFGECASQFRYDCNSYAANFAKTEKIFCRTTRKRELNNTYTIAKECISERDHHRIFPKKDYPLEDECDLLEIAGAETAYCLCRTERCNQKPIAEQFMSFEEKHPELFGDLDEEIPSTAFETDSAPKRAEVIHWHSRPSPTLPLSKATAVKNGGELSPIMPINDPRSVINDNNLRRAQPSFEISKDVVDEGKGRAVLPSRGLDALNIHKITGNSNGKLPAKEMEQLSPWSSARSLAEGPVPSNSAPSLRCMQCGEGGLADTATDCLLQASVSCKHEHSLCFTRHIMIGSGQNAVEKMCVSQEALVAEYGQSLNVHKPETQCTSVSGGRVRVCICADEDNCNQRNVEDQVALSPIARNTVVKAASATLAQPVVPIDLGSELASSQAVAFNGIASSSLAISPDVKPIVPVVVETPTTTTTRSPKLPSGLRCASCSSGDLSDPTADCPTAAVMECMALPGERSYCLTRQTQLSNGQFTLEKTCMTGLEFADDFPDEKAAPGCGTAFDGLVNYCLCGSDMCNQDSLLTQAAENIPAAAQKHHRPTTTSRPLINQVHLKEEEPVQFAMDGDSELPAIVPVPTQKVAEIPDLNTRLIEPVEEEAPEPSDEDKAKIQKMLREQQWKDETERLEEKSVDRVTIVTSSLIVLTMALMR
ncbi:hypothetical protein PFISCL1PPCAC_7119, partial [Pristionchus fissidentatus]